MLGSPGHVIPAPELAEYKKGIRSGAVMAAFYGSLRAPVCTGTLKPCQGQAIISRVISLHESLSHYPPIEPGSSPQQCFEPGVLCFAYWAQT